MSNNATNKFSNSNTVLSTLSASIITTFSTTQRSPNPAAVSNSNFAANTSTVEFTYSAAKCCPKFSTNSLANFNSHESAFISTILGTIFAAECSAFFAPTLSTNKSAVISSNEHSYKFSVNSAINTALIRAIDSAHSRSY